MATGRRLLARGRRFWLEGAVSGQALFLTKSRRSFLGASFLARAPFLVRRAPFLARGATTGQGAPFLARGAPSLARGRRSCLKGAIPVYRGPFVSRGAFLG